MTAIGWAVLCLAYGLGLLLTGISGAVGGVPIGAIALLLTGAFTSFLMPRRWRTGPRSKVWLAAGLVGLLASLYFQFRLPKPEATDISSLLPDAASITPAQIFEIQGRIETPPRLTRSQRIQFELKAIAASTVSSSGQVDASKAVTGRAYVTVPMLQGTGLYPGQKVTIRGSLYKPKPAANPGGFNFQQYLTQQGIFTGLSGKWVDLEGDKRSPSVWWLIRQRIVRSQVVGLGVPEGPLVSAMVMGKGAVDVPYDLQDQFKQAGLAHALAASGAQVSMLVGVVLALTQRLPVRIRFGLGTGVLLFYIGLTGLEASVLRAAVMGFVALLALTMERKIKPVGTILFAATLLLLFNPLWIWDLGFQLSFLATLGLLVTVPILMKWLDWMPTAIASLMAVPIAAYLWTLPLQLYVFGIVSCYSILINILVSPLIVLVSIGGMISASVALIAPSIGSLLVGLLYYPSHLFIQIAELGNQLPGNRFSVGTLTVEQVVILYGLFVLTWGWIRWQKHWWIVGVMSISLVAIPVWYTSTSLFQLTVLSTAQEPVLVFQDRGKVGLINSGGETDTRFTVLPFLQQQGINQIDWAIAPTSQHLNTTGWLQILKNVPIRTFYSDAQFEQALKTVPPNAASGSSRENASNTKRLTDQEILHTLQAHRGKYSPLPLSAILSVGSAQVQLINADPLVLRLKLGEQSWLLLRNLSAAQQQKLVAEKRLPQAQVLWWSGEKLIPKLVAMVKPEVAIAAKSIASETAAWLSKQNITVYSTAQDGAIQWTPKTGFTTTLESTEDLQ